MDFNQLAVYIFVPDRVGKIVTSSLRVTAMIARFLPRRAAKQLFSSFQGTGGRLPPYFMGYFTVWNSGEHRSRWIGLDRTL